jgi:hypothetical protein
MKKIALLLLATGLSLTSKAITPGNENIKLPLYTIAAAEEGEPRNTLENTFRNYIENYLEGDFEEVTGILHQDISKQGFNQNGKLVALQSAKDLSDLSIKSEGRSTFLLELTNDSELDIKATLKNNEGVTIHYDNLSQPGIIQQRYNLQDLPFGTYTLVVASESVLKIQSIFKNEQGIEVNTEALQTVIQPTYRQHSDFLDLNMLCNWNQEVSLTIRDSEGHLIYNETIVQPEESLQRRFDLSMLKEDSYSITVGLSSAMVNQEFMKLFKWSPAIARP